MHSHAFQKQSISACVATSQQMRNSASRLKQKASKTILHFRVWRCSQVLKVANVTRIYSSHSVLFAWGPNFISHSLLTIVACRRIDGPNANYTCNASANRNYAHRAIHSCLCTRLVCFALLVRSTVAIPPFFHVRNTNSSAYNSIDRDWKSRMPTEIPRLTCMQPQAARDCILFPRKAAGEWSNEFFATFHFFAEPEVCHQAKLQLHFTPFFRKLSVL